MDKKKRIIVKILLITIFIFTFLSLNVFAEGEIDTSGIDNLAKIISGVFVKISYFVVFIGALQFAWATKSDNPDLRSQAIKTIAAGMLILAVSKAYTSFFAG